MLSNSWNPANSSNRRKKKTQKTNQSKKPPKPHKKCCACHKLNFSALHLHSGLASRCSWKLLQSDTEALESPGSGSWKSWKTAFEGELQLEVICNRSNGVEYRQHLQHCFQNASEFLEEINNKLIKKRGGQNSLGWRKDVLMGLRNGFVPQEAVTPK